MRPRLEGLEVRVLPTGSTPFTVDGQPWEILAHGPSAVEAENFDYGGEGVAYHSTYTRNPGGKYRPDEGIGIEGPSADTGGTYNVGYFHAGDWMNYTIHVDQAGPYVVNLHASSAAGGGGTAHVSFGGVASGGITIPNTGAWGNYKDFTTTVSLAAGTQVMTVWEDTGEYNLDYISLTPQADAKLPQQPFAPAGTDPNALQRGVPPLLSAFGAAQIEAEDYDQITPLASLPLWVDPLGGEPAATTRHPTRPPTRRANGKACAARPPSPDFRAGSPSSPSGKIG